ncbi:MAG: MarR family winged helix-turn-helix transcriptional regulator [Aquidulcibacter sp.]|uniref:MarR family winged helix-turn-helix transcriptional regulator n=1 Tax=Aquidulcibacter sp. TaxID=2052990 RepID=UPI0022C9824E|nr:MarR family winged helix-turn-helix transcriptional regulator [Aquidulcibacter sp.]MCZ8206838.1 MarR family winged helix-turn-helix transcriptional regulator [Aquidulcibacter sp.]
MVFSRYSIRMTVNYEIDLLSRFARILAAQGYDRGLQPVQWQALRFLEAANRFSRTAKGLTAWLGQTKGSVSQTLIALEGKKLIARETDNADARVVRLNLTQAGRALLADGQTSLPRRMLSHLSSGDQALFVGFVEAMLRTELSKSGGRPFGLCSDCRHFRSGTAGQHYCALLRVQLNELDSQKICIEQESSHVEA